MMNCAVRFNFSPGLKLKRNCVGGTAAAVLCVTLSLCQRAVILQTSPSRYFPQQKEKRNLWPRMEIAPPPSCENLPSLLFSASSLQTTMRAASFRLLQEPSKITQSVASCLDKWAPKDSFPPRLPCALLTMCSNSGLRSNSCWHLPQFITSQLLDVSGAFIALLRGKLQNKKK